MLLFSISKTFHIKEAKGFFPYNHIKNYNSLLMKHFTGNSTTEICSTVIYFTVKEKACKCICFQTTTIITSTHSICTSKMLYALLLRLVRCLTTRHIRGYFKPTINLLAYRQRLPKMGLPGLIEDFDISQYLTDDDDIEALKDELIVLLFSI